MEDNKEATVLVDRVYGVAFHLNGISGAPFHVVLFKHGLIKMVAIVFKEEKHCAVFDIDAATTHGRIGYGDNSWRGDNFEPELRKVIKDWEESQINSQFDSIIASAHEMRKIVKSLLRDADKDGDDDVDEASE